VNCTWINGGCVAKEASSIIKRSLDFYRVYLTWYLLSVDTFTASSSNNEPSCVMFAIAAVVLSALVPSTLAIEATFDPEFYANPWTGVCASGLLQTPIDLPADRASMATVPDELVTTIKMPVVNGPVIKDAGHAMQVRFAAVLSP
jgi:hypothetical protein